jgi:hypothetical protein
MQRTLFTWLSALMLLPHFCYSSNELQKSFEREEGPIVKKTCRDIAQRFGVEVIGLGGGAMNVIRQCNFTFQTCHPYTIEEGRRLVVESAEIFLNNMNQTRKIRPVLAEFPFTAKRIYMAFLIIDPETQHWKTSNSLADISLGDGLITYCIADPETGRLKTIREESFEKALTIVRQGKLAPLEASPIPVAEAPPSTEKEKSSLIQKFFSALESLPGFYEHKKYSGPKTHKAMAWALDKFGCQVAKKYQLQFFRIGDFTDVRPYHYYSFSFTSDKKTILEEGRILGATLFEEIRNALYTTPEIDAYRHWYHEDFHKTTPFNPTPELEQMCFKVVFWDENVDRMMPPHLAQILQLDGVFSYYEADPKTQELHLVFQEPYEEAIAFKNQREKK